MQKRLQSALYKTIILCASTHLVILGFLALTTQNATYINLFSILDLQEFFPGIEKGLTSLLISMGVGLAIYLVFYIRSKR